MEETPRFPLLRIMLGNAFLLSGIYLGLGVVVEAMRRWFPAEWVDRLSLILDSLPGRVLLMLGLMPKLRELYLYHNLSNSALRLIFGVTTVAVIFALALLVGGWMYAARKLLERVHRGGSTPGA